MDTKLLTAREAAQALGICEKTLRAHVAAGDITYVLVGRGAVRQRKKFAASDVEAFIERQRRRELPPGASLSPRFAGHAPRVFDFSDAGKRFREERAAARLAKKAPSRRES